MASERAAPRKHGARRLAKNRDVAPKAPGRDVFGIELDHPPQIQIAAAGNLPQAGHSRQHRRALGEHTGVESCRYVKLEWARTDKAHVTPDDVPELGQLVDAQPPQGRAD